MPDEIKTFWKELLRLSRTQWIIVLSFTVVIGFGLFRVFDWLYKSRFDAQHQLLELKGQTIQYYAGNQLHLPQPKRSTIVAPKGWDPFLDQASNALLAILRDEHVQQRMNRLSADIASLSDARLFVVYVRLYETLPPDQQEALVAEQAEWIERRKQVAGAAVESEGGSLAPYEFNDAFQKLSKDRLRELEARLKH